MTDAERTRQYREFAMLCEDKKRRKCRADCSRCPLNISLYPDLAAGDAVAIQTKAAIDYYEKRSTVIANVIVKALIWAFWIGVALWCWTSFRSCTKPPQQATPPVETIKGETILGKDAEYVIQYIRKFVQDNIIDMDRNNQINCVDYARLFCITLLRTKIAINQHPPMNHAFIGLQLDSGRVVFIEPSPTADNQYLMSIVWAGRDNKGYLNYNSWFNGDRTVIYLMNHRMYNIFEPSPEAEEHQKKLNERVEYDMREEWAKALSLGPRR